MNDVGKFGRLEYMEAQCARHADFLYGVEWQLDKAYQDRAMISDAIACLEDRVHAIDIRVLPTLREYRMDRTEAYQDAVDEGRTKQKQIEQLRASLHDTECELRKLRIEVGVARARVAAFDGEIAGM